MKVKTIIKTGQLFMMAVLLAACASEDVAQDKKKENGTEAPKGGVIFAANGPKASAKRLSIDGEEETAGAKTRTNIKHTPGQGADAYWKWDDFIWVKDKNGTWQKSTHIELHDGGASAEFTLPGSKADYLDGCEVRYTGHGASTFYAEQESPHTVGLYYHYTFPTANDYSWAGHVGDCGSGKAKATGNPDKFNFTLAHKPAYLCFLPRCENAALAPNIRLTHIKMTATKCYNNPSSNLVDLFGFDGETIGPSGYGLYGAGWIEMVISDFPLTTAANPEANATYVIVRPDKYDFKIEYTIKDPTTNLETVITDIKTGITLDKGVIYDVTANLKPKSFNVKDNKWYMWDAKQDYWHGYENEQPTINWGEPGATESQNYPKNDSDPRWYNPYWPNTGTPGYTLRYDAEKNEDFKSLPNSNEMYWYCYEGDPHKGSKVYEQNGHLQNVNGIWLKKKAKILADKHMSASSMEEGYFWGAMVYIDSRVNIPPFRPQAAQIKTTPLGNTDDYFFLPALGYYLYGKLYGYGSVGDYWSVSSYPGGPQAYTMRFDLVQNKVSVIESGQRFTGLPVQPFE